MKTLIAVRNIMATAGLLLAGYVFLKAIPDVRRYIRISTM